MVNQRDLLRDYIKFSELRSYALVTQKLDLSDVSWFYPTLLLPLVTFIEQNRQIDVIPPKDRSTSEYFNIIAKTGFVGKNKSYIPCIKLSDVVDRADELLSELNSFADYFGGKNILYYILDELVDNIYEHSSFSTAYIMAQNIHHRIF